MYHNILTVLLIVFDMLIYRKKSLNKELQNSKDFLAVPDVFARQMDRLNLELVEERKLYEIAVNELDLVISIPPLYQFVDQTLAEIKDLPEEDSQKYKKKITVDKRISLSQLKDKLREQFGAGRRLFISK
jgi:hypothetical protein